MKPQFVQYKTSSTLDSSVSLGSIGAAVDTGLAVFGEMPVPVLAAQPGLGRYTVFANQFASTSQGRVSRLDRHTASAEHAVTPMRESDVRRLLGSQTRRDVLSVDWRLVSEGGNGLVQAWRAVEGGQLAVFDSLSGDDVRRIGGLLAAERGSGIQFGVGSGGLSLALASTLGSLAPVTRHAPVPAASLLAVSGSASGHPGSLVTKSTLHIHHGVSRRAGCSRRPASFV
ncbi:four-carbon acid sugar kinase family protein [Arthrobacter sp. NPDC080031]|uniref:four-carbon acid sugar kinase family protein n=1 Tax=Arthrobacter sp. NPDC080031 TaxID=3155918 RepID=UPI00344B053D